VLAGTGGGDGSVRGTGRDTVAPGAALALADTGRSVSRTGASGRISRVRAASATGGAGSPRSCATVARNLASHSPGVRPLRASSMGSAAASRDGVASVGKACAAGVTGSVAERGGNEDETTRGSDDGTPGGVADPSGGAGGSVGFPSRGATGGPTRRACHSSAMRTCCPAEGWERGGPAIDGAAAGVDGAAAEGDDGGAIGSKTLGLVASPSAGGGGSDAVLRGRGASPAMGDRSPRFADPSSWRIPPRVGGAPRGAASD